MQPWRLANPKPAGWAGSLESQDCLLIPPLSDYTTHPPVLVPLDMHVSAWNAFSSPLCVVKYILREREREREVEGQRERERERERENIKQTPH